MTARSSIKGLPMAAGNVVEAPRAQGNGLAHRARPGGELLSSLAAPFRRSSLEIRDGLAYSAAVRSLFSHYIRLRDGKPDLNDPQAVARSIVRLCSAARSAPNHALMMRAEELIVERVEQLDATKLDWNEFVPDFARSAIGTAAILKPRVSEREKGVILFSRPAEWVRLLGVRNLDDFARSYVPVVAPPWSPPHDVVNYLFPRTYPGPVFSLIANDHDVDTLRRVSKNYRVVPLFASSWVDPDEFHPLPSRERDVDIVMVANFGRFKRHFALFKALRNMPGDLRVVLIGQNQDGRGADAICREAKYYGVHTRITIRPNVPRREVIESLCRSRVSLVLSRREGSCTVVAESLFANTPVGMCEDAHVGSRAFINASTGRLLNQTDLAPQLTDFLASAGEYSPREWAQENISCHKSTAVLNDAIRSHQVAHGERWTEDLAHVCLCPEPRLVFPHDQLRMQAARDLVRDRFGLSIGRS